MDFYYGLSDQPRDYAAARRFAWGERASQFGGIRGTLILAMIYSNGLGTPRDPEVAMRMGCEAAATGESMSVQDLEHFVTVLDSQRKPSPQYDICGAEKPVTQASQNICTQLSAARKQQQWSDQLKAISANWTAEQQQRLQELKHVAIFYLTRISTSSTPVQGLEDRLRDQIEEMAGGRLPPVTAMPGTEAEARLKTVYGELMDQLRAPLKPLDGTHPTEVELSEQYEWVAFRDAWMGLVAARFPNLDADKWRAQLILERTEELQQLSATLPPVDPDAKGWLLTCAQYRDTPLPAEVGTMRSFNLTTQTPKLNVCGSAASYYGIGAAVDYAEAHRCAISERLVLEEPWVGRAGAGSPADVLEITGPATLMMIYANGKGVARNSSLAMRFACEAIDTGRIEHTNGAAGNPQVYEAILPNFLRDVAATSASDEGQPVKTIDICSYLGDWDRVTSTCDHIARLREDSQRKNEIESFAAKFTPEQATAYHEVVAAFEAYLKAHNDREVSVMGHYPSSAQWERQPRQESEFIKAMRSFEAGKLPSSTAAQFEAADQNLNVVYQNLMQTTLNTKDASESSGNIPPAEGLRATEREWLTFRNALVKFGALRYPQVSANSWRAWATKRRLADLKDFGKEPPY